jgi:hypothetical protein
MSRYDQNSNTELEPTVWKLYIQKRSPVWTWAKTDGSMTAPGNKTAKPRQVGFLAGSGTQPNQNANQKPYR